MTDLLKQGLEISVIGMGLTFAALGLLILTMVLLERLFRVPVAGDEEVVPGMAVTDATEDEEIVAAMMAALVVLQAEEPGGYAGLGTTLEAGRGAWWVRGRVWQYGRSPARAPQRRSRT